MMLVECQSQPFDAGKMIGAVFQDGDEAWNWTKIPAQSLWDILSRCFDPVSKNTKKGLVTCSPLDGDTYLRKIKGGLGFCGCVFFPNIPPSATRD